MSQPASFLKQITASSAQPAAENPTVEMIEAAYSHHQLPWRYINFEVPPEALADAVKGARALGFAGFNFGWLVPRCRFPTRGKRRNPPAGHGGG